ncbi:unnamed protein product [Triticum turgidum subsp. durum]|uniref:Uncharacterized protein n=1 Tax=Triticum turgidum subsp. durum TaxID=4567 RepID=A0A9R0YN78_TRITD|nr:unnamed protein product [Triticum turgidum subsp. durum]
MHAQLGSHNASFYFGCPSPRRPAPRTGCPRCRLPPRTHHPTLPLPLHSLPPSLCYTACWHPPSPTTTRPEVHVCSAPCSVLLQAVPVHLPLALEQRAPGPTYPMDAGEPVLDRSHAHPRGRLAWPRWLESHWCPSPVATVGWRADLLSWCLFL